MRLVSSAFSWPCQHINPKLFSRSSFAGRAVILEASTWRAVFRGLSWLGRRPSKTRGFLRFSIRPRDPLRTLAGQPSKTRGFCDFQIARATLCGLWAVGPRKLVGFCNFQIARATLCGVSRGRIASRCGAALIFLKLRTLNRCRASGMCSRAFLARARKRGRAIGIASEVLLVL